MGDVTTASEARIPLFGVALVRRSWAAVRAAVGRAPARTWAFRSVLAMFVAVILASYAIPLWFQLNGDRLLVVTSGSMAPEIEAGDAVVIRQVTSASQLRVGQIITFYPTRSSKLITHRIVALATVVRIDPSGRPMTYSNGDPLTDPYVKTKGDANRVADPNLTLAASVRGIVREIYPRWGSPLGWAHSSIGKLFLFSPPLVMLICAELLSRRRTDHRGTQWPRKSSRAESLAGSAIKEHDSEPALV